MMTSMLKELHDEWLAMKPEGAAHSEDECPICNPEADLEVGDSVKTYTEDEMAAVLTQVAELQAKVKDLEVVRLDSEIEAKLAETKTEYETKVQELQTQLDTTVLEAQAAKDSETALRDFLTATQAEVDRTAEVSKRREERITRIREVVAFPDDHIEANADRWAEMDEEVFTSALEDWKAIAPKGATTPPAQTAMTASTDNTGKGDLWSVLRMRNAGVDIRTIR